MTVTSTRQSLPRHEGRIAVIVANGCEPRQEDPFSPILQSRATWNKNCVLSGTLGTYTGPASGKKL